MKTPKELAELTIFDCCTSRLTEEYKDTGELTCDARRLKQSLEDILSEYMDMGYGMYEVEASFGEPNGQGEPLYYYLTFQGEDKKIDTPIYKFMASSLEEARSMIDLDQVEYVRWSGPPIDSKHLINE